ncbi:MAG: tail fiber protein [Rhodospirillaceae bacterium]
MAEGFIGEIRFLPYTFAPVEWAWCYGQSMAIQQNQALYSIIGTLYGPQPSNTTFVLPTLQAVAPIGAGNGPGLTPRTIGKTYGTTAEALNITKMPLHTHSLNFQVQVQPFSQMTATPTAGVSYASHLVKPGVGTAPASLPPSFYIPGTPDATLADSAISPTGSGTPHENHQPFLGLNACICTNGYYPVPWNT